jgi:hypothetical protein
VNESNVAFGDEPEKFCTALIETTGDADRDLPTLIGEGQQFRKARDEMQVRFGRKEPMDFIIVAVAKGRGEEVRQNIENRVLLNVE